MKNVQGGRSRTAVEPQVAVDPRWLLRAGAVVVAVALLCGYALLCVLFYQGQWQLVLHPVRTARRPAEIGGRGYDVVRFGPDGTGVPQRTGWWIDSGVEARYRHLVVLYLPSGDGSLADAQATLGALRVAGVSVFAIDYRGYGESANVHPTEARMREDAEAAWRYVVNERKIGDNRVIPYGAGVGAALALTLAEVHTRTPAVVLEAPRFDVLARVKADPRAKLMPVRLLLKDRFALEPLLGEMKIPKLILSRGTAETAKTLSAGDPKMTVAMPEFNPVVVEADLRRFLDLYAPPTPEPRLMLNGAPAPAK